MKKTIIRLFVCLIPITRVRRKVRKKLTDVFIHRPKILHNYKEIKKQWLLKNDGKKLLPGRFAEYDVVFAIGVACPMTWELIAHKLRTFANPFDWTAGVQPNNWETKADVWRNTRFIEKIQALCDGFVDFFNKNDLKMVSSPVSPEHHVVYNTRTLIRFVHLFTGDKSIENSWEEVSLKMKRRCEKLIEKIKSSRRVLICWGHRILSQKDKLDAPITDKDIKNAIALLHKAFPDTDIDIVFFEHDGTKRDFEYDKISVCQGAYRIKSNHYVVTNDYEMVCENVSDISYGESVVIAECLDNIKLSGDV